LTNNGDVSQETSFEIDDGDLSKLSPVLFPAVINPQVWLSDDLKASDLELVLVGRHPLLKRSKVICRYTLDQPIPEELEIVSDTLAQLGGGRNTQFTLSLVLAADREAKPGSPFVLGHWLAKKTFNLRSRSNPVLFDIRTRTDAEWAAIGYPEKTFYSVEYQGGLENPTEDGAGSVAIVYVHADAHTKLIDTKLGDSLQPFLASEILATILQQSLPDWEKQTEVAKGSPLETLLKQMQKDGPISLPDLATMAKSNLGKLRAQLQSRLNVVQSLK